MQKHLRNLEFSNFSKSNPDFALKAKMTITVALVTLNKKDGYVDALVTELQQ